MQHIDPNDAKAVAKGLSKRGKEALPFLDTTEARSPYDLKRMGQAGGFTVLESLRRRGLVSEHGAHRVGAMYSPHTTYLYRLTPLGLAVRQALLAEQDRG